MKRRPDAAKQSELSLIIQILFKKLRNIKKNARSSSDSPLLAKRARESRYIVLQSLSGNALARQLGPQLLQLMLHSPTKF